MAVDLAALKASVAVYVANAGLDNGEPGLTEALTTEFGDQSNRCKVPTDHDAYVATPLLEALKRRVAHNLAVRPLPLGVQQMITDAGVGGAPVSGYDPEVSRLEKPYRKRVVG